MTKKRIAAISALVLIGLLYLSALILAFIDSPTARSCLMAAMFCTVVVPAAVYGYLVLFGRKGEDEPGKNQEEEELL